MIISYTHRLGETVPNENLEAKLMHDLFTNTSYDPRARPVLGHGKPINVTISLMMHHVVSLVGNSCHCKLNLIQYLSILSDLG